MFNLKFVKHAEKLFKAKHIQSRPTLRNFDVRDGKVVVTDSHRLYRYTLSAPIQDGTYTSEGGLYTDGNYPNTDKLFPDHHEANLSVYVDVKNVYEFTAKAGQLHTMLNDSKNDHITLEFDLATRKLKTPETQSTVFSAEMPLGQVEQCRDDKFSVNVQVSYLKDAFALLKDLGEKDACIHFYNSNKPLLITTGTLEIILLPVRID